MNIASSIENKIYFSKYKTDSKIGQGSFGKIYSAHHINNGEKYALKLEKRNGNHSLLETETYILCYLKGEGIPFIKSFGFSGEYNILVMELLGKSLEALFQENDCMFSLKTVCMLAEQMITRLEYIHKKYILHRDIKPDNFTLGRGKKSHLVYLIDFGLSKKYRSSKGNHEHIKYSENKRLIGTARYASINALKGCEQGRRDDMEALGYVLMYFLRGNLPWQGLKLNKGDDRYRKIYEKKKNTSPEELCVGYPKQFCEYIKYTRSLAFEQEPDYKYLRQLILNVMDKYEYSLDYRYDWVLHKRQSGNSSSIHINIKNNIYSTHEHKNSNKNTIDIINGSNVIENKNLKSFKSRKKSDNNKSTRINKKKINNDTKLNHTFLPRNNFKQKQFIKKKKENKVIKNNLNSTNKNKNNLFRSSERINSENNKLKKNIYDNNILDKLLNNESFMSFGAFTNEYHNFHHLNNYHYKFLSELNSTSKKSREYTEDKLRQNKETKKIESNIIVNDESKENYCIIY